MGKTLHTSTLTAVVVALPESACCYFAARKDFRTAEMDRDLEFVRARVAGQDDDTEPLFILPPSPP